jgi:hypothetical protein
MDAFDKIVGNDEVKNKLRRIVKALKDPKDYERLGSLSHSLWLLENSAYGVDEVADAFVKEMGLTTMTIRMDYHVGLGDVVESMKKCVREASKMDGPVLIFVKNLFLVSDPNENMLFSRYLSNLVDALPSNIFLLLATHLCVNDELLDAIREAPHFSWIFSLTGPTLCNREDGLMRVLKNVEAEPLNLHDLIAMESEDCNVSDEYLVVLAKNRALLDGRTILKMKDFVDALVYSDGHYDGLNTNGKKRIECAYHEVGHLVIDELLSPGFTGFVSIYNTQMTLGKCIPLKTYESSLKDALASLGGEASVEIKFGRQGFGTNNDFDTARQDLRDHFLYNANKLLPFDKKEADDSSPLSTSENYLVAYELNRYLAKAREIIAGNQDFIEAATKKLLEQNYLLYSDIQQLKKEHPLNDAPLKSFF